MRGSKASMAYIILSVNGIPKAISPRILWGYKTSCGARRWQKAKSGSNCFNEHPWYGATFLAILKQRPEMSSLTGKNMLSF